MTTALDQGSGTIPGFGSIPPLPATPAPKKSQRRAAPAKKPDDKPNPPAENLSEKDSAAGIDSATDSDRVTDSLLPLPNEETTMTTKTAKKKSTKKPAANVHKANGKVDEAGRVPKEPTTFSQSIAQIGRVMHECLAESKMKKFTLVEKLGISASRVDQILGGEDVELSLKLIVRIFRTLGYRIILTTRRLS
jgi:hypothetical protein